MGKQIVKIGGVPEHFNVPWQSALRAMSLGDPGLRAQWLDFPGGTGDLCRALAAGELELAMVLTEGVVKHISSGGSARIVGTYTTSPLIWGVHVSADGPIAHIEQLRGGRYAISRRGSGSHIMAALDASQRGWPEPSFEVVGDLDGGIRALESGSADAFMWEKTMSLPLVHSGKWRRVGEFAGPWPAFVIAASARAIAGGLDWLPEILATVREHCKIASTDRASMARSLGESYKIPLDDVASWLEHTEWDCSTNVSLPMLQRVVDILHAADLLGPAQDVGAMVHVSRPQEGR